MEAEGAIDLLQRATALVELSVSGATGRRDFSGAIKAAVAGAMRSRAAYLGDALAVWQAVHNARPALAGVVSVEAEAGLGTIVLSAAQAEALPAALEARGLAGPAGIGLADPVEAHRPFGARDLIVNGEPLDLPADSASARWALDDLPVAFLLDVGWLAQPTGAHREAVSWSATAGPLGAAVLAALWSARRAERPVATPPGVALAVSFAITLAYTASPIARMRHPHTDAGVSRYPWVMALQGYELVRVVTSESLGRRARAAGWAGTAAIVATGSAMSPTPRSARALVAELG